MDNYDIFISYRWSGDVAYEHDGRGWVAGFKAALESRLGTPLKPIRIFLDLDDIPGNRPLHESLRDAIESSTVFLPIVSGSASQMGSWARWELAHFVNCASPAYGLPADRIFKAAMFEVGRAAQPETLRNYVEYKFYRNLGKNEDGEPYPCHVEELSNPATPPGLEFNRLCEDLTQCLAGATEAPPADTAPAMRAVYVASTTLAEKRDRLCGDLRQKGYRILAENPWPDCSQEQFEEYIGSRMVGADASIHVLGGQRPLSGGWNDPAEDVELRKAMDVADRPEKRAFRTYTWQDSARSVGAPTLPAPLLARLRRTRSVNSFEGKGWEYTLSNIFLGLQGLKTQVDPPPDIAPPPQYDCQVFIQCLEDDRDLAQEIREKLEAHRVWVSFLPQTLKFWQRKNLRARPGNDDAQILQRFQRFYRECDGALVLFGDTTEFWAFARCDEIRDFLGDDLAHKAPAICLAPPEEDKKRTFQYQGFSRYRLAEIQNYVSRLPCHQPDQD